MTDNKSKAKKQDKTTYLALENFMSIKGRCIKGKSYEFDAQYAKYLKQAGVIK